MRIIRVTMVRIFLLEFQVNYWKFGCVYEPRDYTDKFVVWSEVSKKTLCDVKLRVLSCSV